MKIRVCRDCGRDENDAKFYGLDTSAGRSAGDCCRQCWINRSVEWRRKNRDRWNRGRHFRALHKKFGITQSEFDELYRNPICSGCGARESPNKTGNKRLALDHDHASGKIRGLLCHDCNRTIATAHDNPGILRRLADYLEKYQ